MHSSTSGRQCSGISNPQDRLDLDTEDPGVDWLDIWEGEAQHAEEEQSCSPLGLDGNEVDGKDPWAKELFQPQFKPAGWNNLPDVAWVSSLQGL